MIRGLYQNGILNKHIDAIEGYYLACDIEGGADGKISFNEIIMAVDNMDVFYKPSTEADEELPTEDDVTLEDLRKILVKIDIVEDKHIDKIEFMLLALDHSVIFSIENF